MPRPNILLITTDQQRYDTMSCNGSAIGRTPHLDAMAARGTILDHCYNQNPVCISSRACLQTGRYCHQHGVRYMESEIDTTPGLPAWEWTCHERLRRAGYHTAAFGKIHMMPDRGFDTAEVCGGKGARWTQQTGLPIGPAPLGPQYAAWVEERCPGGYEQIYEARRTPEYKARRTALAHPLPAELHVDTWIGDNTVEFISEPPAEPWFVWCGFTGPHGPLDVPPEYLARYRPEDMPTPAHFEHDLSDRFPYRGRKPRTLTPAEDELTRFWTAYYHALDDLIDDQVARIAKVFDERGLWDNTLVLFTSDHGEMGGDFGLYGKGNFYEAVTRLPAFVVPPGGSQHRRLEGLVEMFDYAATALDFAGLEQPVQMAASSLRPELETGRGGREAVFCEYVTNDRARQGIMVRTATHKLVLWHEAEESGGELYDLVEDPEELVNRYGDPGLSQPQRELAERIVQRRLEVECAVPQTEWHAADA